MGRAEGDYPINTHSYEYSSRLGEWWPAHRVQGWRSREGGPGRKERFLEQRTKLPNWTARYFRQYQLVRPIVYLL